MNRYIRSGSANSTDAFIYHQSHSRSHRLPIPLASNLSSPNSVGTRARSTIGHTINQSQEVHHYRNSLNVAYDRPTKIPISGINTVIQSSSKSSTTTLNESSSTSTKKKKTPSPKLTNKKNNSNRSTKKNSDGSSTDSTESISSMSSGSPKRATQVFQENNQSELNTAENVDEAVLIKRLAELEGINKKNIEQLKRLEQDYSSSQSNIEIPITIQLAKNAAAGNNRPVKKRTGMSPDIYAVIYDKSNSTSGKTVTKTRYDGPDLTPVLSTSSMQSPQLSPASQVSTSVQESSFTSTQSSSSTALTNESKVDLEGEKQVAVDEVQSSIDIEIYNTNNQIDDYNDYSLRHSTHLRPKVNQRKQKPYRVECTDYTHEDKSQVIVVCTINLTMIITRINNL